MGIGLDDRLAVAVDLRLEYDLLLQAYTGVIAKIGMCCLSRADNEDAQRVIERARGVLSTDDIESAARRPTMETRAMTHAPRFDVKQRRDGQWTVVLVAANGEPLATGEGYTLQKDAVRACDAIRRAAATATVCVIPPVPAAGG